MRSMVEGARGMETNITADAPTTALRAVPLPRSTSLRGGG
jgi:hypothetical protein